MLTGSKQPLIWPLLDKLRPMVAFQQRPRSSAPLGVVRLPTMPWDAGAKPVGVAFGSVEKTPTLWEMAPWNIGQEKIGNQPILLQNFKTNPRALAVSEQKRVPGVIHPLKLPARIGQISGVTKDSAGAILGGCVVDLFLTATDVKIDATVSNATTGIFIFTHASYSPATHYIVAYKAGSPDVAGTTLNTLTEA